MNNFEYFNSLTQLLAALNSCVIVLSKDLTLVLSTVILYQKRAEENDKGKLTGETLPEITYITNESVVLTPEELRVFLPVWKQKIDLSDKIRACVTAIDKEISPQFTNQLQLAAAPEETAPAAPAQKLKGENL